MAPILAMAKRFEMLGATTDGKADQVAFADILVE